MKQAVICLAFVVSQFAGAAAPKAVRAGGAHICAVMSDTKAQCWGYNLYGQLGVGTKVDKSKPMEIVGLQSTEKIADVVTGTNHLCVLLTDGRIKCVGYNATLGTCGAGKTDTSISVTPGAAVAVNLGTNVKAKKLVAGNYHTCAILTDDSMKCWGRNTSGELGLGDTKARGINNTDMGDSLLRVKLGTGKTVKDVCLGTSHTCALLNDSTVKCWGLGNLGQHGGEVAVNLGDSTTEMGDNLKPVKLGTGKVTKLQCGNNHTCVRMDNGKIRCWGYNGFGQLGVGNTASIGSAQNQMGVP